MKRYYRTKKIDPLEGNKKRRKITYVADMLKRRYKPSRSYLTDQYDAMTSYKYRPLPYYKRRAAYKKKTTFAKNLEALEATQTVSFRDVQTLSFVGTAQPYYFTALYGTNGTNIVGNTGMQDLNLVANNDITTGSSVYRFKYAENTIEFRNTTSQDIILDVYEVYFRSSSQTHVNFAQMVSDAVTETPTISGAGTGIDLNQKGVKPFDLPVLCKNMKITKMTKFQVKPTEMMSYCMRSRQRNRLFAEDMVVNAARTNFVKPKLTRGVLLIFKLATDSASSFAVDIDSFRTYRYTRPGVTSARDQRL